MSSVVAPSRAGAPTSVATMSTLGATSRSIPATGWRLDTSWLAKRALDVVVASLVLLLSLPVMLVIAMLIRATSTGPVLFRQRRFGRDGRMFAMFKFRTMHVDAEAQLARLLVEREDLATEMRSTWKLRNDPRVTRVGAFLRRLSLDELPQLLNVLRGDMSLVGPRPRRDPDELSSYGVDVPVMLSVLPGMTGAWQVSGRNLLPEDERVRLDLAYARERTLAGDLAILLRTIPAVLLPGRGAM